MMTLYVSMGENGISVSGALTGEAEADLERQLVALLRKWWARREAVRAVEEEGPA